MKTTFSSAWIAAWLALAMIAGATPAFAGETAIWLSSGFEYSTGNYGGAEDIEEIYVPLTFSLNSGRIGMSVSVPHLSVHAPSGTVTDAQPVPGDTVTESGLGDVTARLTVYDVYYSADLDFALDVTGAVKFGTADLDKGLGTGENDYSLYLDGYKWFDGFTLLGSVGYRFRGEPEGVDLNNVLMGSVGGSWSVGSGSMIGVIFDYRESALDDSDDIREISAFGTVPLGEHWRLQLYGFSGLTDSSPDCGAGLALMTDARRMVPFGSNKPAVIPELEVINSGEAQ